MNRRNFLKALGITPFVPSILKTKEKSPASCIATPSASASSSDNISINDDCTLTKGDGNDYDIVWDCYEYHRDLHEKWLEESA